MKLGGCSINGRMFSVVMRLNFWRRVVEPSMLWGLQTCRKPTQKTLTTFAHAQHTMIRNMMRKKKLLGEAWLDWHERTLAIAEDIARYYRIGVEYVLAERKESWAGHLIRLGCKSGV